MRFGAAGFWAKIAPNASCDFQELIPELTENGEDPELVLQIINPCGSVFFFGLGSNHWPKFSIGPYTKITTIFQLPLIKHIIIKQF